MFIQHLPAQFRTQARNRGISLGVGERCTSTKVSLQSHHHDRPPWTVSGSPRDEDKAATWLYCDGCHACLFGRSDVAPSHVPFRDQASVGALQGNIAAQAAAAPAFSAPLELRRRWRLARARAARENRPARRKLEFGNLVPVPRPQFWQNAPEVAFDELASEDAKGHLSCCNLHSAMECHADEKGRSAYSYASGESAIWRRQPKQLSSTLAFMYGRDEGKLYKVRSDELKPLRECLLWLREHNPFFKVYWSSAEQFGTLYTKLQAVIPRGSGETKVRMQRNSRTDDAVATTLGETLGALESVLVIVDPDELPKAWSSVEALAMGIGEQQYRLEVGGEGREQMFPGGSSGAVAAGVLSPRESSLIQKAAANVMSKAMVTLGDQHLDAKLFPHLHPYGSGSLRAEGGSGGMQHHAKNRICSLDDAFRSSPVWSFWMLERLIKNDLYFKRRRYAESVETHASEPSAVSVAPPSGTKRSAAEAELPDNQPDKYAKLFGTTLFRNVIVVGAPSVTQTSNSVSPPAAQVRIPRCRLPMSGGLRPSRGLRFPTGSAWGRCRSLRALLSPLPGQLPDQMCRGGVKPIRGVIRAPWQCTGLFVAPPPDEGRDVSDA